MGHVRLGTLPMTRSWQQVVDLLDTRADVMEIAAATSAAARSGFEQANGDPALVESFWLLTQLPLAAREPDFVAGLRERGIDVHQPPTLVELAAAFTEAVDGRMRLKGGRTDLGEMAELAAIETLTEVVGARLPTLFGNTPTDVQSVLSGLATEKQFGAFARDFFSRFVKRYFDYYLSRELSAHVGGGSRFQSIDEHAEFNKALAQHCFETARIVEDFAGQWFSKTNWEHGITRRRSEGFAYVAFKKLGAELRKREGNNDGR